MFDKIGQAAEKAATSVSLSRRGFLEHLGQTTLGAAGVLAGMLALPRTASAGNNKLYQCGCIQPGGGPGAIWNECGRCSWKLHGCAGKGRQTAIGTC
jgi:hypothetical protein